MLCPDCGYAMDAFDKECPRCHGKEIRVPQREAQQAPAPQQMPQVGTAAAAIALNQKAVRGCAIGCGALFALFVVLPVGCSMLFSGPSTTSPYVTRPPITNPYADSPAVREVGPDVQIAPVPAPPPEPQADADSLTDVWVNTDSGIYHYQGQRWYAVTEEGEFMSEAEAKQKGYRANEGN